MVKKASTGTKDFPLFQHRNGQWAKKVKGKLHYFGTGKAEALEQWLQDKDYLLAGRKPPRESSEPTLAELGNLYLDRCRKRVSAGDGMSQRTVDDYEASLGKFISHFGANYRVSDLTAVDFGNFKLSLFEPSAESKGPGGRKVSKRSPVTVNGNVREIRTWLNWCRANQLIPEIDYGTGFGLLGKVDRRKQAGKRGRKDHTREACLAFIEHATVPMRAMIYLALNAGLGNGDLAAMRTEQLQDRGGEVWVDYPRPKTGAQRRFVLWPETVAAIKAFQAKRPPARLCDKRLLFVTKGGREWLRYTSAAVKTDEIGNQFGLVRKKALAAIGQEESQSAKNGFYGLRHTFRTVASQTADAEAVELVMGHVEADEMASNYTHEISDDRIRKVCFQVRDWLVGPEGNGSQ